MKIADEKRFAKALTKTLSENWDGVTEKSQQKYMREEFTLAEIERLSEQMETLFDLLESRLDCMDELLETMEKEMLKE